MISEGSGFIEVRSHGQEIASSNFWGSRTEQAGKYYCSPNAGAVRLLVPRSLVDVVAEWRKAEYVVLSRGPWPEQAAAEAVELMFEDGSDSPHAVHLTEHFFSLMPAEPAANREWVFAAWCDTGQGPQKALQLPCKWRRSRRLPDLSRWE